MRSTLAEYVWGSFEITSDEGSQQNVTAAIPEYSRARLTVALKIRLTLISSLTVFGSSYPNIMIYVDLASTHPY